MRAGLPIEPLHVSSRHPRTVTPPMLRVRLSRHRGELLYPGAPRAIRSGIRRLATLSETAILGVRFAGTGSGVGRLAATGCHASSGSADGWQRRGCGTGKVSAVYLRFMDDRWLPELEAEPPGSPARAASRALHDIPGNWADVSNARVINRYASMSSNFSKSIPARVQLLRVQHASTHCRRDR